MIARQAPMASINIQNLNLPGRRPYEVSIKRLTSDAGETFIVLTLAVPFGDRCSLLDVQEAELRSIRDTLSEFLGEPSPGEVIDWMQKQEVLCTEVESSGLTSMEALTDALIDLCSDARAKFGVPA
jgi:hypothetical protein